MIQSAKNLGIKYFIWLGVSIGLAIIAGILNQTTTGSIFLILATIVASLPLLLLAGQAILSRQAHSSLAFLSAGLLAVLAQSWWLAFFMILVGLLISLIRELIKKRLLRRISLWTDIKVPLVRLMRLHREELVSYAQLRELDRITINPGERIPVDGFLLSKEGHVENPFLPHAEESLVKGDPVVAGSTALDHILLEAKYVGKESSWLILSQHIKKLFANPPAHLIKSRTWLFWLQLAWIAAVVVWVFLAGTAQEGAWLAVAGLWWSGPWLANLLNLNLSTRAVRSGIIFKEWSSIKKLRQTDLAVLDKTGTLTLSWSRLVEIKTTQDLEEEDVVRLAAALEHFIDHPIARAITRKAQVMGLPVPQATNSKILIGLGVAADVAGESFALGSSALVESMKLKIPEKMRARAEFQESQGATVIYLANSKEVIGMFVLMDILRPSAKELVQNLYRVGMTEVQIISGDDKAPVQNVAKGLALKKASAWANLSPQRKVEHIKKLSDRNVLLIADPASDREALAQAYAGVGFLGHGPALADSHVLTFIRVPNLALVFRALKLSRSLFSLWIYTPLAGLIISMIAIVLVFLLLT